MSAAGGMSGAVGVKACTSGSSAAHCSGVCAALEGLATKAVARTCRGNVEGRARAPSDEGNWKPCETMLILIALKAAA